LQNKLKTWCRYSC